MKRAADTKGYPDSFANLYFRDLVLHWVRSLKNKFRQRKIFNSRASKIAEITQTTIHDLKLSSSIKGLSEKINIVLLAEVLVVLKTDGLYRSYCSDVVLHKASL